MQKILFLMLGYPGAGKTTAAQLIHELTGAVHLSSDEMRVELFAHPDFSQAEHDKLYDELDNRTEELLKQGSHVIYDANLNRRRHRRDKYDICRRGGAQPVLLWLKAPKDLAKERASHISRLHLWPKQESPDDMFERIAGVIEEPGPDEPYIELDGTRITPKYISEVLKDYLH